MSADARPDDRSADAPLHPSLEPLAWLLGTWTGTGVGGYPTVESFRFAQEVVVSSDGSPALRWSSRSWLLDEQGRVVRAGASESGAWRRPQASDGPDVPARTSDEPDVPARTSDEPDVPARTSDEPDVELVLAHGTGHVEVWVGRTDGSRVELATDLVAGTVTAKSVTAGTRLYGLVDGDLLWAYDMAAVGQPLQPHLSATLRRAPAG